MKNIVTLLFAAQTLLVAALVGVNIYSAHRLYLLEREYQPPSDERLSNIEERLKCIGITLQWIERNTDETQKLISKSVNPNMPASPYQNPSPPTPC